MRSDPERGLRKQAVAPGHTVRTLATAGASEFASADSRAWCGGPNAAGTARASELVRKGKITVKEIRRILVPVDFSDHSQRALEEAIAFATTFGAEVHLLHCYPINAQAIAPYGLIVPETFERDVRMAALKRLAEWRDKVSAAGCKVQEHVSAQFPSEAIAEMAGRQKVDLIVMGTRGLTGFKHVLLGSIAERTIRTAPCPVLTVKRSEAR
jgi:nucleotide-binding universal stress UspA family protein